MLSLTIVTLLLSSRPAWSLDADQLEKKVSDLAEQLLGCKDMVGFSVGVVHNGQTLLTQGYGLSDINKQTPVTQNTLFGIASLSKAFTATLLCHLVDQHPNFTLDSAVSEILGSDFHFATCQLTRQATLRDLMSHRTGMLSYNTIRLDDSLTRDSLLQRIRFLPPAYELRSKYRYNNLMYGILAKVTEVIGGDTWENLMRTHIFEPLGMNSSTFTHETDLSSDNIATAYYRDPGQENAWRETSLELHKHWGQLGGSGSIITNAVDVINWLHFQLSLGQNRQGNRVMSEQVVQETHTPYMVIPECYKCEYYRKPYLNVTYGWNTYGLGWRSGIYRDERLVTHTGTSWGYTGMISLLPDAGIGIHTSVSGTDPLYEGRRALHSYIMDLLLGHEPQVTLENACTFPYYDQQPDTYYYHYDSQVDEPKLDAKAAAPYIGTYRHFGFGNITVFYNDTLETLQMKYGQLGLWDLVRNEKEHEFTGMGRDHVWSMTLYTLIFTPSDSGPMDSLTVEYFEPNNPPVFERGLQSVSAPAPEECDSPCSRGSRLDVTGLFVALLCLHILQFLQC